MNQKKYWTKEVALSEMRRWCASQERSQYDVRAKLIAHQVFGDHQEELIATLIEENFLNETRYAMAYVSGKLKINEWGRNKIVAGLKLKNVSTYNIKKAMDSIEIDVYQNILTKLIFNKSKNLDLKKQDHKNKVMSYLLQKGFTFDEVNEKLMSKEE